MALQWQYYLPLTETDRMETSHVYHPCQPCDTWGMGRGRVLSIAGGKNHTANCDLAQLQTWWNVDWFCAGGRSVKAIDVVQWKQIKASFVHLQSCVVLMNIAEHRMCSRPYTTSKSANVWAVWGCGNQFVTSSWRPWSIWGSDPFMPGLLVGFYQHGNKILPVPEVQIYTDLHNATTLQRLLGIPLQLAQRLFTKLSLEEFCQDTPNLARLVTAMRASQKEMLPQHLEVAVTKCDANSSQTYPACSDWLKLKWQLCTLAFISRKLIGAGGR